MKVTTFRAGLSLASGLLIMLASAGRTWAIQPVNLPDINVVFSNVSTPIDETYGAFYFADGSVYLESLGTISGSVTKTVNFTGDNTANPLGAVIVGDYGTSFYQQPLGGILPADQVLPGVTLGSTSSVVTGWIDNNTLIDGIGAGLGAPENVFSLFDYINTQAAEGYLSGAVSGNTADETFIKSLSAADYVAVDGAAGLLANFIALDPDRNGGVTITTASTPLPASLWAALAGLGAIAVHASRRKVALS